MMYDVAIIGGGISGLATAYDLKRSGHKVILLERQQNVGGNAISEQIDGFLMEHGPTTLNALVPQAVELTGELGLSGQKLDLGDGVKKRYLREGNELHAVSIHPAGFLTSPYLSVKGRLAVLSEILRPARRNGAEETVYQFAARRFGVEFAERVMDPLAAGMFAGDARQLSVEAVFPKLVEMEHRFGSISRGVIRARRGSEPAKRLFSFKNGVATLPLALARLLKDEIHTGVAVNRLQRLQNGFELETARHGNISCKSAVLAVQPHVAAGLLEKLDISGAGAAAAISAPPLSVVFTTYKRQQIAHPLDSLGFLSVAGKGGIITGAQFSSTMFGGRAPQGYVSVSSYVGGVRNRDAAMTDRAELQDQVHRELAQYLQISGEPQMSRCRQWPTSLPQYVIGHADKVAQLTSVSQRQPGLYITGNYLSGVSMANCIGQARATAKSVNNYLRFTKCSELVQGRFEQNTG